MLYSYSLLIPNNNLWFIFSYLGPSSINCHLLILSPLNQPSPEGGDATGVVPVIWSAVSRGVGLWLLLGLFVQNGPGSTRQSGDGGGSCSWVSGRTDCTETGETKWRAAWRPQALVYRWIRTGHLWPFEDECLSEALLPRQTLGAVFG